MSRRQKVIFAALGLLAAFIAWLAWSSRQPPMVPDDETHRSTQNPAACLSCHGQDGPSPRSPRHPFGDECFRCHGSR